MFSCLFFNQKSKASRAELQKLGKSDRLLGGVRVVNCGNE